MGGGGTPSLPPPPPPPPKESDQEIQARVAKERLLARQRRGRAATQIAGDLGTAPVNVKTLLGGTA